MLNIENRTIFCRDNIDILQGINSDSIDLIYLDPPFNKDKKFTAPIGSSAEGAGFKDYFREEDVKDEWLQTISEDNPELYNFLNGVKLISTNKYYIYNFCYLAYMAIRLLEMHRILKQTGCIYLHCDSTMSHYLKLLLDIIFGEKNFKNEVTWKRTSAHNDGMKFGRITDSIFYYQKSDTHQFKNVFVPREDASYFPYREEKTGRHYRLEKIDGKGKQNTRMVFGHKVTSPIGRMFWSQEKIDEAVADNKIIYDPIKHKKPYVKKYMDDDEGNQIQNLWADISTNTMKENEKTKYPTQKPLALLERIIKASSSEGDIVLDPFCGCATTCVASEKLKRQWVGIDVSHKAYELVEKRLAKEVEWSDSLFHENLINYTTTPPKRTDAGANDSLQKYVYVISHKQYQGEYKVGIAKNVKARLGSYQTADPNRDYQLEYSLHTPHFRAIEKYIHEKYDNKHEWVSGKLADIVADIKAYPSNIG